MFWVWIILIAVGGLIAALAVFLGVMYLIGRSLPVGHVNTCVLTINQPIEKVYETIADVPAWPTWDPGVNRVEETAGPADGVFRGKMFMGRNVMGVESRRVSPPMRHEITVEDLAAKIFTGVWRYELTPTANGCTVKLVEDGKIHSPIPRAMARKIADPKLYMKRHLKMIAKKFGEPANVS